VQEVTYCKDTYTVTTANGQTRKFWERNLRLMTDASGRGPAKNAPVIVRAGMMGDRADVIFADPSEKFHDAPLTPSRNAPEVYLAWLPVVVLMLVKESSDLALQLSRVEHLAHRNSVVKEFVLDRSRQIVPLHDDSGAQAPQNMLLVLSEGSQFIAILLRRALCGTALVVPSCEGIGLVRAFACAVRHQECRLWRGLLRAFAHCLGFRPNLEI
jgi:hypothetical protein